MGQEPSRGSGPETCCSWRRPAASSPPPAAATTRGAALEAGLPRPPHTRTSSRAAFRLRCSEKPGQGHDRSHPVQLVVFDLDETLTLVTFMTPTGGYQPYECEWARKANFESPWVEGSRIGKLQQMLKSLAKDTQGRPRALAILTKNQHRGGVAAVLNLLKVADLADPFCVIWTMPWRLASANGAYQDGRTWRYFEPPVDQVHNHKADLLHHVAKNPKKWFPQLGRGDGGDFKGLLALKPEGIVLVDDQRANFQSDTGLSVIRYCKVARYDAHFLNFGLLKDMGGIGAHDDADYETLRRFVEDPWMCKETQQVHCLQRDFEGDQKHPVTLVVFDFDETITLATFMPKDEACTTQMGWSPGRNASGEWTEAELVTYNFESPFVQGSRVEKLRKLFEDVACAGSGQRRVLAILTRNESGVVAVLNLLRMAGLADPFSAIWTIPHRDAIASGAYQEQGEWRLFEPPVNEVHDHKADVLHHVAENPAAWFPQIASGASGPLAGLTQLRLEGIALVDDERANFRSYAASQAKVLRYCKVARYDEVYRDCGSLNQMGGIGAHNDADYEALRLFLEQPWEHPYEPQPAAASNGLPGVGPGNAPPADWLRTTASEESPKAARMRR